MNLLDFFYLRDQVLSVSQVLPSTKNSLLAPIHDKSIARFSSPADIDWLVSYLGKASEEPVAYLGAHICCPLILK
jgi:hypothetical protein